MSILIGWRNFQKQSELWALRILQGLAPHVKYVATYHPPCATWGPGVRLVNLAPPLATPARLLARLTFPSLDPGLSILHRLIHDPHIDCILMHFLQWSLHYERALARCGKPLFIYSHGLDAAWHYDWTRFLPPRARHAHFLDRVHRLADSARFIANSRWMQRQLINLGIPADRILLHYFGIPALQTLDTPPADPAVPLRVLFIGRLVPFKGPDKLIQAFDLALRQGLRGSLTLAGDGPLISRCQHLRSISFDPARIHLLGSVTYEQGEHLRRRAHVFAAHNCPDPRTGAEESFGVAFAEAMGTGLPVISARSGALDEFVLHNQTGFLVPPGDIEAQASLFLLLERTPSLRHHLSRSAWTFVKTHFPESNNSSRLLHLLQGTQC